MKKKVLVTGVLGFIGSNFIKELVKNPNYTLVGADNALYDYCLANTFKQDNYTFYLADIANEHIIDRIFKLEKPDIVFNLAAQSFVCNSIENPNPFIYSNVMGTQTLINASVKYNVSKFIQVSTDEVLGSHKTRHDIPWTEESPPKPRNPYSASKLAAESILYAANQTHKLPFNITRCCNVFGPRQPTDRNLIPKAIKNALKEIPMPIYGDGSHIREYIHVEDKISALLTVLEQGQDNEIYNIGSDNELTNTEVVKSIAKFFGKDPKIDYTTDRKGHDFRYSLNSSKLRKLGWKPKHTFDSGLKSTINWYLNNKEWFELGSK